MKHVHWLGTGLSSIPGIRRLAENLDNLTVWNRTLEKAQISINHVNKTNVKAKEFDIDKIFNETKPGDIVVGGKNFGVGSSREQAAASLVILGVRYVVAKSFARIFYRNAFNLGLTPLICEDYSKIKPLDILEINPEKGIITNFTQESEYITNSVPEHLLKIVNAGGLLEELKNKINNNSIKTLRFRKDN